ncbi:hypothetical protein J422_02909 [Methanocaldococcus villosus KIN24-T80]|uniref:Uncharacterized protein n=1 Tax=Methanocaldococcus villosus KIN24-T80 TaxID=1069083 RepID=N6V288_9EURY|nr:hypothetical protein [Methanocaldococcus villosus]ENN96388.1 hypothetical protein J422_02909 [Methanocaldococcus villosus KIN24-T80]
MENWKLTYKVKCFNCGKEVDQIIEIFPNQAFITCSNCGAKRYYIIRRVGIEDEKIINEEREKEHKYEPWFLEKKAVCFNCKNEAIQDIVVTESKLIVRCRHCGFTRVYLFHILEL